MSGNDPANHSLFDAVESNDANAAAAVQQAIRDGANVNVVRYQWTPLMHACRRGNADIVGILLDAGADEGWKDSSGRSAILEACWDGHLSTVQLLLNHDICLLDSVDDDGWTPLIFAIDGQHSDIVRFLLDQGADPHHVDQSGVTTLMHASAHDSLEIARLLLADGLDVEARDPGQSTALHCAALCGRVDVVRELIRQHNANMFAVNKYGKTPFDTARHSTWRNTAAVVDHLLEVYGNKFTQDHGSIALHELLKVAEYSFAEDKEFHPPLNPLQIVLPLGKLTLTHLCTLLPSLDPELIRTRDDTGKLPIHVACQTNAPVEVLALILELDLDVLRIADAAGALPIHLLCGDATAETEMASVRYLIQSFPGSMAVQTNAGDYPFMMAANDSSLASLSVVYELVRANPGLAVPR